MNYKLNKIYQQSQLWTMVAFYRPSLEVNKTIFKRATLAAYKQRSPYLTTIVRSLVQRVTRRRSKSGFNGRIGVQPGHVNRNPLAMPEHIVKPPYVDEVCSGSSDPHGVRPIKALDSETIEKVRHASQIVRKVLDKAALECNRVGITTGEIDRILHNYMVTELHSYPSPLNYLSFPKSVCTSVNNVVCHGIPDDRPLKNGDVLNVDVSVYHNGVHGDASEMIAIGDTDAKLLDLIGCTRTCLSEAIKICKPGAKFSEIGQIVSEIAEKHGYSVCDAFCGHGIGREFHCSPLIHHSVNSDERVMEPGMVFTIEPILCEGSGDIKLWDDGWTAVTVDGGYSAQVEHTIAITESGCDILSKLIKSDLK